ncbi:DUF2334 domain-containing protein [Halobium salinum]|uniref:DUF2334 domain-containing protein n=1 Tax=Halobium salinum TaxID=1364940 RepID=A0ABD5P6M4_9EURY|nr:DUF2334 domain-containing protein [Halobium salinum]
MIDLGGDAKPCGRCGGTSRRRRLAYEHEPCGRIDLTTDDCGAVSCPRCAVGSEDRTHPEFAHVGTVDECRNCGYREHATDATPAEPEGSDRAVARPSLSALVAGGAGAARRTATVALVVLLVTTAVGAGVPTGLVGGVSFDGNEGQPATTQPTEWREYRTIVVFRNDDPQPAYHFETLLAVDRVFVEENVPLTTGVVGAPHGEELEPDSRFCRYLRANERRHPELVEYALHGYSHRTETAFASGSEFGGLPAAEQQRRVERGTEAVTDCVGQRPRTFVPPLNSYDRNTTAALSAAGYRTVSGGGWFTKAYYNRSGTFESGGLRHTPSVSGFVANWSTGEFHDRERLYGDFDRSYRNGSIHVQMLHYQYFATADRRQLLREYLRHAKSKPGVRFMTLGELSTGLDEGTVVRTDDGWRVLESTDPTDRSDSTDPTDRSDSTDPTDRSDRSDRAGSALGTAGGEGVGADGPAPSVGSPAASRPVRLPVTGGRR